MSTRHRKNHKSYRIHTKKAQFTDCEFCSFTPSNPAVLKEHRLFWIVKNIYPYDLWDGSEVKDHLMIVPKRHVNSISDFSTKEKQKFIDLLGIYESQGYSLYARAPQSLRKSVDHQHTHLFKIGKFHKKIILFVKKPWILFTR